MRGGFRLWLAGSLGALTSASDAGAASGDIANLGTLGGIDSFGYAVNDAGQVTGYSFTAGDFEQHAFLYSAGVMHDLGSLGGNDSQGYALNASGQVTGGNFAGGNPAHAFLYAGTPGSGGAMVGLGTLGGASSAGFGINASGQIAGQSLVTGNAAGHAFLYTGTPGSGGMMHDLDTLGGLESFAHAINDSGAVVGDSHNTPDSGVNAPVHAFLYTGTPGVDGQMHDLGTLGGTSSIARAINNAGQVAGRTDIADNFDRAFLYTGIPGSGGQMHDLGTLGGTYSEALAINDAGHIAGYSGAAGDDAMHAFLYTGTPGVDGEMIDLDAWLDAANPIEGAKWTLVEARGISDTGWITGIGTYDDGPEGLSDGTRAFLLDASALIPEPAGVAALALFIPALLRRRRGVNL